MSHEVDRRNHARYALPSMYTTLTLLDEQGNALQEGHVYDISEGGMRFELDEALEPGSTVTVQIDLPGHNSRDVRAVCNVLWVEEEDLEQPGPVRMACSFVSLADAPALASMLNRGRYHFAA